MKRWIFRAIAIAALIVVGLWVWRTFFPGPERAILNRIAQVAKLASFDTKESEVTKAMTVLNLVGCFTTDVECSFDTPDMGAWVGNGRNDIRDVALVSRARFKSLRVEFFDIAISFAPDKQTATVNLTVRISLPSDKDFIVKAAKFTMRNVEGDWLISRAETVKTFL